MVVIDTQATANIDVLHYDVMSLQLVLQLVDAVAESLEVTHVKYLTTNMEVQTQELDVLHFGSLLNHALHITHGDTKLVFSQTCCNVGMGMSTNVWVDAEANLCNLIFLLGKFVDDFQFRDALYIEAEDALVQTKVDFPITLAYTGIHNLIGRETCIDGSLNFSSAHTVGTQTSLADDVEHFRVGICLYGIVYLEALMLASLYVDGLQGLAQHVGVVVVERSLYLLKLIYRKCTFHFAYTYYLISYYS